MYFQDKIGAMTDMPSEHAVTAWARLQRSSRALLAGVEADLKAAGLPPLAWYDVLLELERAGPEGLRPFRLQERLLLAQYNLSRLLDRMEKGGLVERLPCDDDGRGQVVRIAEAGLSLRRKMWAVYGRSIGERFAGRLGLWELTSLADILAKLN